MKLPKETKRYCPHCKEHTTQQVLTQKQKARSATHPMSRWGTARVALRSYRSGYGNMGRFSKPAVKSWKRKTKSTKRITILFKCKKCNKMKGMSSAIRSSRIEIGEKISK